MLDELCVFSVGLHVLDRSHLSQCQRDNIRKDAIMCCCVGTVQRRNQAKTGYHT